MGQKAQCVCLYGVEQMKKKELIEKIERAIEKNKKIKLELAGDNNPQIIEMRKSAEAKQEAFESILLAMCGNSVYLDIEAG